MAYIMNLIMKSSNINVKSGMAQLRRAIGFIYSAMSGSLVIS